MNVRRRWCVAVGMAVAFAVGPATVVLAQGVARSRAPGAPGPAADEDESSISREWWERVVTPEASSAWAREPWSRHLGAIVRALALDDTQTDALRGLLAKFDADREAASATFEQFSAALRDAATANAPDPARNERAQAGWVAYEAYRIDRAARFTAALRALLTPEQDQRWPLYERVLVRLQWANAVKGAGRRADLEAVVSRVFERRPRPDAFAPILETYAIEMDRILLRLDEADRAYTRDVPALGEVQRRERRSNLIAQRHEISRDILVLNRDTLAKLLAAADVRDRGLLLDEFHLQSIHEGMKFHTNKAPLERIRESVESLPDLTSAQRDAFEQAWEAGMDKIRALRTAQYAELLDYGPVPEQAIAPDTNAAMQRAHAEFPLRIELVGRLRPIFSPQQRERMPACMRDWPPPARPVYEAPEVRR